jgi:hypothetical protein
VLATLCATAAPVAGCASLGRKSGPQPRENESTGEGSSKAADTPPAGFVWIGEGKTKQFGVFDANTGALLHVSPLPTALQRRAGCRRVRSLGTARSWYTTLSSTACSVRSSF